MYAEWLVAGLTFPEGGLKEQLLAAKELVPPELLEAEDLGEDLAECLAEGQYHFGMDTLQQIGIVAEAYDRDAELPPEFWVRVASAAHGMEFPQFVPYCLGKAQGLPKQDPGDLMAAFATMPTLESESVELRSNSSRVADIVQTDDPTTADLIANRQLDALATHLRNGAYDRLGQPLSELFSESFDELFGLVTSKGFPAEYVRHAWAVIGPNPFRVVLEGGLMPITSAEVWWRAN